MSKPTMTLDEIIAVIRKSNVLNMIVEGSDDVIVYRRIESEANKISPVPISIVPAGGRTVVLDLFNSLVGTEDFKKCIFVCDQDIWAFGRIPDQYIHEKMIFTDGYSIENDVLRDHDALRLMSDEEKTRFLQELNQFKYWFARQVDKHMNGEGSAISTHVGNVLQNCSEVALQKFKEEIKTSGLIEKIESEPEKLLRGKSYLDLIVRQLSHKDRRPKHSRLAILEQCSVANGMFYNRINNYVQAFCRNGKLN